jgi:hypothetical protein
VRERAEYRLRYPLLAQPAVRLRLGEREIAGRIEDLSESGALCSAPPGHGVAPGDRLSGQIALAQRRSFEFAGQCLRVRHGQIAIGFDSRCRVPLAVMFTEQRSVRARFPDWR